MSSAAPPPDQAALAELRLSLGRLEAALGVISDALVICQGDGAVVWSNRAFQQLVQATGLSLLGRPLQQVLGALVPPAVLERLAAGSTNNERLRLEGDPARAFELEWRPVPTERERTSILCLRDISAQVQRNQLRSRLEELRSGGPEGDDRRAQVLQQLALATQIRECAITGLPNRRGLVEGLGEELRRIQSQGGLLCVMVCSLERFQEINDLYGHACGDALLIHLSARLQAAIGPNDLVGRLSHDDFIVATGSASSTAEAVQQALRLQEAINAPWRYEGRLLSPAARIGISCTTGISTHLEELLRQASVAMLQARRSGGVALYQPGFDEHLQRRAHVREQLEQALGGEGLFLEMQPIVNLTDGSTVGMEALVRIRRPGGGRLAPGLFIPEAESTGLVVPLGQWIIKQALEDLRRLRAREHRHLRHDHYVSVNVSPVELHQPGFAERFLAESRRQEVSPGHVVVEVTESMLIEQPHTARRELQRLRDAGVRVYLDDFGTGFSSMSWLAELPVDAVKIDQSFIRPITRDRRQAQLTRRMVELCHDLGLKVVAEGIEQPEQRELLLEMGCEMGQGHLFSPARPVAAGRWPNWRRGSGARPHSPQPHPAR